MLAGLLLVVVLAALDMDMIETALPIVTKDLGGLPYLSWIVSAFLFTSATGSPFCVRIGERYGNERTLLAAIGLFLIASTLCSLAWSTEALIVFRAFQGFSAGALIVLPQIIAQDTFQTWKRKRPRELFPAVFAVCAVAGPVIGGVLVRYVSWRWMFLVNVPLCLIAVTLIIWP